MNTLLKIIVTAAVAYALTHIMRGVQFTSFTGALIFSLVLALLNLLVKPLLVVLTIPITVVTFGLFLLVINALIILLADKLLDSFSVTGFGWALLFSLAISIVSGLVNSLLGLKD